MKLRRKTKFIAIVTVMITAVAGYSFAADTLTDSIKNGKISGESPCRSRKRWLPMTQSSGAIRHWQAPESRCTREGCEHQCTGRTDRGAEPRPPHPHRR